MKVRKIAEDLGLQRIERVVFVEDLAGEREVALDVGIQRVAQHALGDVGHPRDVDELLDRGVAQIAARGLGDVDRQVAHALEVGVDFHARDDRPEVDRHRLVQRQNLEALLRSRSGAG